MSSADTQHYLICPITLELFDDPVIAEDGNTYERKAITEWITRHGTSPITKKSLTIDQLTPNLVIKDTVEAFKHQQAQHNVQSSVNTTGKKRKSTENLDVLCRYCGLTQQLNSVKKHQLQCSSNPVNIVPFNIADNEIIFTTSQETSSDNKHFRYDKIFSFANPLARRTTNLSITEGPNQTPIRRKADNPTFAKLSREGRFSLLKNRRVKWFLTILLIIVLATIAITLTAYYVKRPTKEFLPAPTTFTSTSTIVSSTTVPFTSTSTMVSTTTITFTSPVASTSTMTSASTTASASTINSTTASSLASTITSTTTSSPASSFPSTPQPICASAEWSSSGITVASDLYRPGDVAIDSEDNIIVADTENHRLQKYFNNGKNITLFTKVKALSIFTDKFDNIYIAESFSDEVNILNSNGELITTIDGSNISDSIHDRLILDAQSGLYVDKNNTVYISDTGNHRVIKYFINLSYGIVVAGGKGQGPELNQLNGPYGIYVDEVNEIGAIYICDHQNHRIQKWLSGASEGITVAVNNDQLHSPMSILLQPIADQMIMYISSFSGNQVLKWIPYAQEAESIVVGVSGHMGTEADRLFAPRGIKFDKYWNLFVADTGNDRIQKFLFNTSSCENNN